MSNDSNKSHGPGDTAAAGANGADTAATSQQAAARRGELTAAQLADPVRIRRTQIARWTLLANRVGYLFVALAMALFFMAFAFGFNSVMATMIIIAMIIGFVLLAPSIILGYAIKAADRDDRERGL